MYLAPEGQELEIAEAARDILVDSFPIERLQKPDGTDLAVAGRKALAELGWYGLSVSEESGGSNLTAVEHVLFFREVGRLCGPLDILTQCLAAKIVQDPQLRDEFLSGESGCCLVIKDSGGYRLLGNPQSQFGLLATPAGDSLYSMAGVDADMRPGLDPVNTMRVCGTLPLPAFDASTSEAWRFGQLGVAAMLVGISEAALELIVEYAKVRETFGKKIGSWQAVRHPCSDMAVRLEAARAQLWFAAAACKEGKTDADIHVMAAKYLANNAAYMNADSTIQLHGGIGVTQEHAAHFLLKHAMLLSRIFGNKRDLLTGMLHARLDS